MLHARILWQITRNRPAWRRVELGYCQVHEASYVIPENAPGSEFVLGFLSSVCFTSAYSTLSSHDGDGTINCVVSS